MAYISPKQKLAMRYIEKLVAEFGKERWFTTAELPGISEHSTKALADKGYLETKSGELYGMTYYRYVKPLEEKE